MKNKCNFPIWVQVCALFCSFFFTGCSTSNQIVKKWETGKVFKKPESIAYDSIHDFLYVTNINGSTTKKDGNGFISRMKVNGSIDSLEWFSGFDAPKGIIYNDNHLYLTDINAVYIINIDEQKIINKIVISDAIFLNDIAVTDDETIYVSDTKRNCVFKIGDKTDVTTLNGEYKGANGLFIKGGYLYIGTSSCIYKYNMSTDEQVLICNNTGNVDGLYVFSDTHFLISNFVNKLTEIKNNKKTVLYKGIPLINSCADFYYIESSQSIIVPAFNEDKVKNFAFPNNN